MFYNFKVKWSYKTSDGIFHRECDIFYCELSARDAVQRVFADYSEYQDLRIEGVWRECYDCWDYVEPILWETDD